jgi:hypothetical protein
MQAFIFAVATLWRWSGGCGGVRTTERGRGLCATSAPETLFLPPHGVRAQRVHLGRSF